MKCKWTESTDYDGDQIWDTECGECFVLIEASKPSDNNFNYCTYCGKEIEEVMK